MPFVSQAQRRKFYATPSLRKYIPEYEAATGGRRLPERAGKKHKARKHSIMHELHKRGRK